MVLPFDMWDSLEYAVSSEVNCSNQARFSLTRQPVRNSLPLVLALYPSRIAVFTDASHGV